MRFQAQPYRKGAREPGHALRAMLKGRTSGGWNPKDIERARMLTQAKRRRRPPRPPRPPR